MGIKIDAEQTSYQPYYDGSDGGSLPVNVDEGGNLTVRAQVLTDEGGFRANFVNSSLWTSIGGSCTFMAGESVVLGSGFLSIDMRVGDYVAPDADRANAQQIVWFTDTEITLGAPWSGVDAIGVASSRSKLMSTVGAGGGITVSNGQMLMTSGTTINSKTGVYRLIDTPALVGTFQVTLSQRIANQTFYCGFANNPDPTLATSYAYINFDGTTVTSAKGVTARNSTTIPTGGEIQTTTLTITTTATAAEYRVELLRDRVMFFQTDSLKGTNKVSMPAQSDPMYFVSWWVNGGSAPASTTTATVDFVQVANNNELAMSFISREPQVINQSQIAGTTISTGSGTNGTGVQRVTIATDQAALTTAGLISVKVDQTTDGSTNKVSSAGLPTTSATNACTTGLASAFTVLNIKATAGSVYGISVTNPNASVIYVQFYNTAGTPTLGTSVVWWLAVPASATLTIPPSMLALANHATGIGIGASTTPTSTGTPGSAPSATIFYK